MTRQEICLYVVMSFILLVFAVGGYILELQDRKQLKEAKRTLRHQYDEDKQQATDDIEAVYKELIMEEICK